MGLTPGQLISALGVGLIAVFWAYDGWVYITWVAGEVKEPRRNVPLAMVLGVLAVGAIYLAMNMVYVYALPMSEIAKYETIAHAAAATLFSPGAALWLSAMIAISCFSAAATCTLSGARVYLAMAQDGVFFRRMAVIHPKWRTPAFSLIGQGIWAARPHHERTLRPALHLRHLRHGAFLHADRHRSVRVALEKTRHAPPLSLHRISVAARNLRSGRRRLDTKYHHHQRPTEAFWGAAIVAAACRGICFWKWKSRERDRPPEIAKISSYTGVAVFRLGLKNGSGTTVAVVFMRCASIVNSI